MPMIKLKDNKIKIITYYESILNDFNDKIELEENKYPLTDREKVFVTTIRELLTTLDRNTKRF